MLVIPAIDLRGGRCVRLFQGDYAKETVYSDDPAGQAKKFEEAGARIIHLVDLDGAKAGHPVNLDAIRSICAAVKIPCELGGGIRTEADAEEVFSAGVSRVILGTVACENPKLAADFVKKFGAEKVVVGIDAKNGYVAIKGWIEESKTLATELAVKMASLGVKRFIFTDIATDGALTGPNVKSMSQFCDLLPGAQVIASGGVSAAKDMTSLRELAKANLEGAIVGKALYDGRASFKELEKAASGR
jgi:phosphoribosylformimino-5-aminoimidazole carboxamide ribotide isomerase